MIRTIDTWGTGLASYLGGYHDGWLTIAPAFGGIEISLQFWEAEQHGWDAALDLPARVFVGNCSRVSSRQLIAAATGGATHLEHGEVWINADSHVGWPYHAPPPVGTAGNYAQYMDPPRYADWVAWLARLYPAANFQILNEPGFQRGAPMHPEHYADLVTEVARCVDPSRLMAGSGVEENYGGVAFDDVWTATAPQDVAIGVHPAILHRFTDPDDLRTIYHNYASGYRGRYGRRTWLDETLPVGRLPGGTTTPLGAELYAVALDEFVLLANRGTIVGAGIGFCGGLEPPCSPVWNVCSGLIDENGNLTMGGLQVRASAQALGFWRDIQQPQPIGDDEMTKDQGIEMVDAALKALRLSKPKSGKVIEREVELQRLRDLRKELRKE